MAFPGESALISAPQLWTPGKKPALGVPLEVNWDHPYTRGLQTCIVDLRGNLAARGYTAEIYPSGNVYMDTIRGEPWIYCGDGGGGGVGYIEFYVDKNQWEDSGANAHKNGTYLVEFMNRSINNNYSTWCSVNASTGPSHYYYASLIYEAIFTSSRVEGITPAAGITITQPNVYAVRRNEDTTNNHRVYQAQTEGHREPLSLVATNTKNNTFNMYANNRLGDSLVSGLDWGGWFKHMFMWNWELPEEWVKQLAYDPYQILQPKF